MPCGDGSLFERVLPVFNDLARFDLCHPWNAVLCLHDGSDADVAPFFNDGAVVDHGADVDEAAAFDDAGGVDDCFGKNDRAGHDDGRRADIGGFVDDGCEFDASRFDALAEHQPQFIVAQRGQHFRRIILEIGKIHAFSYDVGSVAAVVKEGNGFITAALGGQIGDRSAKAAGSQND